MNLTGTIPGASPPALPLTGLFRVDLPGGPALLAEYGWGAAVQWWSLPAGGATPQPMTAPAPGQIDPAILTFADRTLTIPADRFERMLDADVPSVLPDNAGLSSARVPVAQVAGRLYAADPDGSGITGFGMDGARPGVALAGVAGPTADMAGITALVGTATDGQPFLVAAGAGGSLAVWAVGADGALTVAPVAAPNPGIGGPVRLVAVDVGGIGHVVAAGAQSSSLTVYRVDPDGGLTVTDHIVDTLTTRFGGASQLDVLQMGGRTYVAAAGTDDGVSLFVLRPDGRLHHLAAVEDTLAARLDNPGGLALVAGEGQVRVFAGSEWPTGIHAFAHAVGSAGLTLTGSAGADSMVGGGGDDMISGAAGNDSLSGGGGADILMGGGGLDTLTGGAGADVFVLSAGGRRTLVTDFEPGLDRLDLSLWPMLRTSAQLTITGSGTGTLVQFGTEELDLRRTDGGGVSAAEVAAALILTVDRPPQGTASDLAVYGSDAADTLVAGGSGARLFGRNGDDVLIPVSGTVHLDGGAGRDRVSYEGAASAVVVDLSGDTPAGGAAAGHVHVSIEDVTGSAWSDGLTGSEVANRMFGGAGADTVIAAAGNDYVEGNSGADHLSGGAGNDTLYGQSAQDALQGDAENDALYGGAGIDTLYGGDGNDQLVGNTAADVLYGGNGNDQLFGSEGRDSLSGDDGDDTLRGGTGADTMWSGPGRDVLFGGDQNDQLFAGAADDRLYGGNGGDSLWGEDGNDQLWGDAGFDWLFGGAGNDLLWGGDQGDVLDGGAGDDRLDGGTGNDTLTGGPGADAFEFRVGSGADIIADFDVAADRLALTPALWGGGGVSGAMALAGLSEAGVVFAFGTAGSLTLTGVTSLDGLESRIDLI